MVTDRRTDGSNTKEAGNLHSVGCKRNHSRILVQVVNRAMCHAQDIISRYLVLGYTTGLGIFFKIIVINYQFSLHDDVIKRKHFPCYWPFVRGIHRSIFTKWNKFLNFVCTIFWLDIEHVWGFVGFFFRSGLLLIYLFYLLLNRTTSSGVDPGSRSRILLRCRTFAIKYAQRFALFSG